MPSEISGAADSKDAGTNTAEEAAEATETAASEAEPSEAEPSEAE
jgi:hypothetical protein